MALAFPPYGREENYSHHNRIDIIGLSLETYAKLAGIAAINEIEKFIELGIERTKKEYIFLFFEIAFIML